MKLKWQDSINYSLLTQQRFLEETAWVILASGMSDKVVQKKFPLIKKAMFEFSSPMLILEHREKCFKTAIKGFNHAGKINAILYLAEELVNHSFETIKELIDRYGIQYLQIVSPYIEMPPLITLQRT